jgi:cyclic dehypoxanthinyl futalosine synthase
MAQIGLKFGADDFGSLLIEENVVSAAGTRHLVTLDQMIKAIRDAGFEPRKRLN